MRDPTAGAGLVIVQGRQHAFGLESVWKSDTLPKPGTVVDVEFDAAGRVSAMMAVPEARLAREQAEAAIALAATKSASVVARLGWPQLTALGLLVLGWCGLASIEVEGSARDAWRLTLWRALGALDYHQPFAALSDEPAASLGVYRLVALVCVAGPLLSGVWTDRRAHLAAVLPLAFMFAVLAPVLELTHVARASAAWSVGAGAYVSALAAVYLAAVGVRRFLVAQARDAIVFYEND